MFRYLLRIFLIFDFIDVYSVMDTFVPIECNFSMNAYIWYQGYYLLFSECFYILLLLVVIIYRLSISGPQIECLGRLIWIIISGLFIEIIILSYSLSFFQTVSFFNGQFVYSPFIIFLKIFICIIAICIFFSMLDYFQYENFISYELLLLCYYV